MPLVTLEPFEDGTYRIAEELSDEPGRPEPGDDTGSVPDDNRQVVFLGSSTLFRAGSPRSGSSDVRARDDSIRPPCRVRCNVPARQVLRVKDGSDGLRQDRR
jgi:hypothetical protein